MESSAQVRPAPATLPLHRRLTLRPTLVLCAALAGWAAIPLLALAAKTLLGDESPTGAYGLVAIDQLQYLAWIREAGDHGLISNLFTIGPPHHVFLHPFFSVSGILWRLGVPLQLAYLVWVPITVAALFYGITAYVQRMLPEG